MPVVMVSVGTKQFAEWALLTLAHESFLRMEAVRAFERPGRYAPRRNERDDAFDVGEIRTYQFAVDWARLYRLPRCCWSGEAHPADSSECRHAAQTVCAAEEYFCIVSRARERAVALAQTRKVFFGALTGPYLTRRLDHRVRGREDENGAAAVSLILNRARYQPDRQPRHQLTERLEGGTALVTSELEVVHRRCRLSVARLGDRVLEVASGRVVHGSGRVGQYAIGDGALGPCQT